MPTLNPFYSLSLLVKKKGVLEFEVINLWLSQSPI